MSRLNQVIQNQERAANASKAAKKNTKLPVYSTSGKAVRPERKKRNNHLAVLLLTVTAIGAFIYMPQFFMKDSVNSSSTVKVKLDTSAIKLSTNAMKGNPSKDFDNDGIENSEENKQETNLWFIDSDRDGLTDYCETYITKTNPNSPDEDYLIDQQKKMDDANKKNLGSPYKIGNVILWADDYHSKAYGSVVKTTTGYRFTDFNGYAQFPESDGQYAYKLENGVRTSLPYREDENVYKISAGDTVEIYDKKLEETVDFALFGFHFYAPENAATSIISMILPDKGFISAQLKTKMDVEPDTRKSTTADIAKPSYDINDNTRFTMNTNTLNDLQYLCQTIQGGNCVAVSLYSPGEGEYIAIAYGYTYEGDILLADAKSLKPIGTLAITEKARKIMNEEGNLVSYSYFDFEGFGFNSETHFDRISFFASTGETTQDNTFADENEKDSKTNENTNDSQNSKTDEGTDSKNPDSQNNGNETGNDDSSDTNQEGSSQNKTDSNDIDWDE